MSESPNLEEKGEGSPKSFTTPETSDLESGDHGILVKSNPLARELKGRHMQMIAIGMRLEPLPCQPELLLTSSF
jgi:amino acid transporter